MRTFSWTSESVEFMCRAEARSSYSDMLAAHIVPYLSDTMTVYEPGCGIGGLTLALQPYVPSLTAADIDPLPLSVLQRRIAERGLTNITVLEQDALQLSGNVSYDAAVFCFFGLPEEILAFARKHVKKHVFIIKRAYKKHRFSVKDIPITGDSLETMQTLLTAQGIRFDAELLSAEMGQPLRSAEEARRFFKLYGKDNETDTLTDEGLLRRLTKTDDPEFPYYLPGRKEVGLIHFSAEDL